LDSSDTAGIAAYNKRLEELGLRNGKEDDLIAWVKSQAQNTVSVDDLFNEAYRLAGGDYFQAMLLSHNVLRGHIYGGDNPANLWGNRHDPQIQNAMEPLLTFGQDKVGHRYHLFGMMIFGFLQAGQWKLPRLPFPSSDANADFYRDLAVFVEEYIVSGDMLTEPDEAAVDKEGFDTGRDFYTDVFNQSLADLKNRPSTIEGCGELEVSISVDPQNPAVGEYAFFSSTVTGGEKPYVYYWNFGDGGTSVLSSDTHAFQKEDTFTVTLTVLDANDLKGEASLEVAVGTTVEPTVAGSCLLNGGVCYEYGPGIGDFGMVESICEWETADGITYGGAPSKNPCPTENVYGRCAGDHTGDGWTDKIYYSPEFDNGDPSLLCKKGTWMSGG
jgi:hypothetical protein